MRGEEGLVSFSREENGVEKSCVGCNFILHGDFGRICRREVVRGKARGKTAREWRRRRKNTAALGLDVRKGGLCLDRFRQERARRIVYRYQIGQPGRATSTRRTPANAHTLVFIQICPPPAPFKN